MKDIMRKIFNRNKYAGFVFIGMLLFFSACSPREDVPREFPDEEEMGRILADLYITESIISHGRGSSAGSIAGEEEIPAYYKDVLQDYDLTIEKFDTIRKWYAAHPYHYQKVYENLLVVLSSREADLNREILAEEAREDSLPEIVDLWEDERTLLIEAEDTTNRQLPFELEIDSLLGGEIKLRAFYKFLREDFTRDGQVWMITMYADSTADTITHPLEKTFKEKSFSLVQDLDSVQPVINVSGYLFEHDTSEVTAIEFSQIRLEHLYYDDNDSTAVMDDKPAGFKPVRNPDDD